MQASILPIKYITILTYNCIKLNLFFLFTVIVAAAFVLLLSSSSTEAPTQGFPMQSVYSTPT